MKSEELHQEMADFRNQLTDSITARIVSGDGRSINKSAPEMILGMDFFNLDFNEKDCCIDGDNVWIYWPSIPRVTIPQ